jgi:hypothetical protein
MQVNHKKDGNIAENIMEKSAFFIGFSGAVLLNKEKNLTSFSVIRKLKKVFF